MKPDTFAPRMYLIILFCLNQWLKRNVFNLNVPVFARKVFFGLSSALTESISASSVMLEWIGDSYHRGHV